MAPEAFAVTGHAMRTASEADVHALERKVFRA
jgi:hypothetical protein